jgi:putative transposase
VQIIHSRARASHTRGGIERFFRTLHAFESTLPGYAGENATQRDHERIARLWANTRDWIARGAPADADPYPNRLLLEDEYKRRMLLWLTVDYHAQAVQGSRTRLDLYTSSAPPSSRVAFNLGDLTLAFSQRLARTVRGNGTIFYRNRAYALPNGDLMAYQGATIAVLVNDLMPDRTLTAAMPTPHGLRVLGVLEDVTFASDSDEARAYRRKAREVVRDLRAMADAIQHEYTNPELRHDRVLERAADLPPVTYTLPTPTPAALDTAPDQTYRRSLEADMRELMGEGIQFDEDISADEIRRLENGGEP